MHAENLAIHVESIKPFDGCDPDFSAAIKVFAGQISPSHSLTSRRYSVWSAVRDCLDKSFGDCIESYSGEWQRALLCGTKLSEVGVRPPQLRLEFDALDGAFARRPSYSSLRNAASGSARPPTMLAVDWQAANLEAWDENIKYAICSAQDGVLETTAQACSQFCATLDTVRTLLSVLGTFRPSRSTCSLSGGLLADGRTRPQGTTYCELCWRETMRSGVLTRYRDLHPGASGRGLSDRYCEVHNPSAAGSRYRADLPYKSAFMAELGALNLNGVSVFSFRFPLPNGADTQERRKTAYDQVHARLRAVATKNGSSAGLRERVWMMRSGGLHQAEIARQLCISRQAVSKALKSLGELVKTRSVERYLNPVTGEVALDGDVFGRIKALPSQGLTVSDIAAQTGLFKHTIHQALRVLE